MLQVTQKGNGRKKIFNLINVMFRYVETRYVFSGAVACETDTRTYMKKNQQTFRLWKEARNQHKNKALKSNAS